MKRGNCGSSNAGVRVRGQNYEFAQRAAKVSPLILTEDPNIAPMNAIARSASAAARYSARPLRAPSIVRQNANSARQHARTATRSSLLPRGLTASSAQQHAFTISYALSAAYETLVTAIRSSRFSQTLKACASQGFVTTGCSNIDSSCNKNLGAFSSSMNRFITSMAARTITVLTILNCGSVLTQPGFGRLIITAQAVAASNMGSFAAKAAN